MKIIEFRIRSKKNGFQQRLEYKEQFMNNKVTEHCNTNDNNSRNDSCNHKLENINYHNKKLSIGKEK